MITARDWTGLKFGRLTFTKPAGRNSQNRIIWEAQCECGNTHTLEPGRAKNGSIQSCGCFHQELMRNNSYAQEGRKHEPRISTAKTVWRNTYSDGDIKFEEFLELSQLNCHYCNSPPSNSTNRIVKGSSWFQRELGTFIYNGLDRIDSNKKHTLDNVVSCCWLCNEMKKNRSYQSFMDHIKRIYEYSISDPKD